MKKKFIVDICQTNSYIFEVEAKDWKEAEEKAQDFLEEKTFEDMSEISQRGYWEVVNSEEVE